MSAEQSSKPLPIREERPLRIQIAEAVAEAIIENIPLNAETTIMDYGCGTGLVSLLLAPRCSHLTAIETSQRQLDILEEKITSNDVKNVSTCCFDLEKQPWQAGSFHLIIISMTLHHLADIQTIIDRFSSMLHPGGCLVIADLDVEDGSFHDGRPGVKHFGFDRTTLQQTLKQSGLSPTCCTTLITLKKNHPHQREKSYPMFIIYGQKQPA